MPYLVGLYVGIDEFFPTNTKFFDLDFVLQSTHTDIDFSLFFFLLQPVFLTLTVNITMITSFKVAYIFSALVFSVYVAALQSSHTAFSGFLFSACDSKHTFFWGLNDAHMYQYTSQLIT